jgi:alkylation response protein AidB-like acyl-CoA dehydrogenase
MNSETIQIETPDSPELQSLCNELAQSAGEPSTGWPEKQLELLKSAGVYRWFVPKDLGGLGWSSTDLTIGYVQLASACLTTTFVLTQRVAAIKRICASENEGLKQNLLPGLLDGSGPATVGISHLTTSRRHLDKPVLAVSPNNDGDGFVVNGFSPWVTGGSQAKFIVMGAELSDGNQILFTIPSDANGITVEPGFDLVALSDSQTGVVRCKDVQVSRDWILGGPTENVLAGKAPSTGSFQTSALAIGLSQAAIEFVREESLKRPELKKSLEALDQQQSKIKKALFELASGITSCTKEELRTEANSLVLRSTQSAMVAAKGTGFVKGHRVGRWCQEALFFLVWSCPQSVLNASLCELAGIDLVGDSCRESPSQ